MRCIVEHPDWGIFIGTNPLGKGLWTKKIVTGDFPACSVVTFDDQVAALQFFIHSTPQEHLARMMYHFSPWKKTHIGLEELRKLGLLGERTERLLWHRPSQGRA